MRQVLLPGRISAMNYGSPVVAKDGKHGVVNRIASSGGNDVIWVSERSRGDDFRFAGQFSLDLLNPVGFFQASDWLARQVCKAAGWPRPLSVLVTHRKRCMIGMALTLSFEGESRHRVIDIYTVGPKQTGLAAWKVGEDPRYLLVVEGISKQETAADALRMACMVYAGVEDESSEAIKGAS